MMISFNNDKAIGKVVFIVEGQNRELTLLRHLFTHVLNYSYVEVKRNESPVEKYINPNNPNSRIFVISSLTSSINSINDGQTYLDNVYLELWETYQLDPTNSAIYYVFDRDPQSNNNINLYNELISKLKNSRDNGLDNNGLLLISYPSIEAFVIGCFEHDTYTLKYQCLPTEHSSFDCPRGIKEYVSNHQYYQENIDKEKLKCATNEMINNMLHITGEPFRVEYLDCFNSYNRSIFQHENEYYQSNPKLFRLLSCLACAFIDLGVIEIHNQQ